MNIMDLIIDLRSYSSDPMSSEALKIRNELLSLQLSDGGFAYMGNISDCDVTAMALQSLSIYCGDEEVEKVIEEALEFISSVQESDGSFCTNINNLGKVSTSESTSQVIIALCDLNIDILSDDRFIKNGNNAYHGLLSFQVGNQEYCHIHGGKKNNMATEQALSALDAMCKNGYDISESETFTEYEFNETEIGVSENHLFNSSRYGYKPLGVGIILIAFIAYMIFKGRKSKKRILSALIVTFVSIAVILSVNIQSKESYYNDVLESKGNYKSYIAIEFPEEEKDISYEEVSFSKGETVFDVLEKYCVLHDMQLDYTGKEGSFLYIKGINYVYEKEYGTYSGWMYSVNGDAPDVGCGDYELANEDYILWYYVTEPGKE